MIYKWISVDNLIAKIESQHNVNAPEYIHWLPMWVNQALRELKVMLPLEPHEHDITVTNHVAMLPTDVKALSLITKDNIPVLRSNKKGLPYVKPTQYNDYVATIIPILKIGENPLLPLSAEAIPVELLNYRGFTYEYILHHNKMIECNFENGTVKVRYLRIPTETDEMTGIKYPMIPDSEPVLTNIMWYILMCLLYKGYKHPLLNLGNAMPYLNPAKMYEGTKASARNSLMVWDSEKYEIIQNVLTSIVSENKYVERNYNS